MNLGKPSPSAVNRLKKFHNFMKYWNPAARGIRVYGFEIVKFLIFFKAFYLYSNGVLPRFIPYGYIILIFFLYKIRRQKVADFLGQFSRIKAGKLKTPISRIKAVAKKMSFNEEIIFLYDKSSHYSANVVRYDKKKYFILTRNLCALSIKKPKYFDSIVAHELSHLIRNDTTLWLDNTRLKELVILFALHLFFITVYTGSLEEIYNAIFYALLFILLGRPTLKASRFNAEKIADLAAVAYTNSYSILNVLIEGYIKPYEDGSHPNLEERINSITLYCEEGIFTKVRIWDFMFKL